jgi:cytochrome c peroxidase
VDAVPGYRRRFGRVFPGVRAGAPVDIEMFARAIAEFEFSLTFADAPIDRYARGDNEHATYTFGAQVGDAIVAYSFPAKKLNCMSRVAVTPAKVTKSKLGIQ